MLPTILETAGSLFKEDCGCGNLKLKIDYFNFPSPCNSKLSVVSFCVDSNNFTLTVLHTNDVHARFDESTASGAVCRNSTIFKCYGGVARRMTAVRQMRQLHGPNILLLDAGDQFQGTLWFYKHRGMAAAHFMNQLKYDAMVRTLLENEYNKSQAGIIWRT
jgi:5'-nucleotidase